MARAWRRGGSTRAWNKRRRWWAAQLPVACMYCSEAVEPGSDWHLSHTVPRVDGGRDRDSRPAHALCNLRAGSRLWPELQSEPDPMEAQQPQPVTAFRIR